MYVNIDESRHQKLTVKPEHTKIINDCQQSRKQPSFQPMLEIRIRMIRMLLGLMDPDPLDEGTDTDPDPDPSITKQK